MSMNTPSIPPPIRCLKPLLAGITEVNESDNCNISQLTADSRAVRPGSLFCAYRGLTADGRDYIGDAVGNGACAVLFEAGDAGDAEDCGVPAYSVRNLQQQLGNIAHRFYGTPSQQLLVIGVTGTNGKTTCAHLTAQALKCLNLNTGMSGTLGSGLIESIAPQSLTTPDAIQVHAILDELLRQHADAVAMEVSSHALDQGRVNGVEFDIAVFTNLTRDHLDYHDTMQAYGTAKASLFSLPAIRHAIINIDDAFGSDLLKQVPPGKVLTYGSSDADIQLLDVVVESDGLFLHLKTPAGPVRFRSRLLGRINVPNLLAVTATLFALEYYVDDIAATMTQLRPVPGRMELFRGSERAPAVVVDYSHTPDALEQALLSLREHTQGRLWCVFGCGGDRDKGKRPQMGAVAERQADYVVLTDDNPRTEDGGQIIRDILTGMKSMPVRQTRDRRQAIAYAINNAQVGDLVLVAGKGHETTQTIGDQLITLSDREVVQTCLQEVMH